ncbi:MULTISPECIES: Fe-S cluster assembly protein NifU [Methylosinus]|uniref:Nitrogen fixation protein NifU n=1 Tax=Methylosinus trichosporium (strain ATCC 35070 / NCIMB 11131 / UNIQEM 75 / OB3b) TaxID=595536 RepID=A0A2D2CZ36_METT3|nr:MULTISPECIES: Fe-S cluster assembly protein NifU [Methylosinus]ATQ67954.1 Fe-S cluster assembly protein NifU [Methylosinus trichosporium OB3b]OBS53765.1 Fe-S cluster assembly protein NifU [Methylosinus sp. 3S-1]
MWDYSEKVKEHFFNPKNAGVLSTANAVGEVGALACGDALKLMLHIDPVTEIILDARFQAYGCGSAIASSSAVTELVIGKTLAQASAIGSRDIANHLGGLPVEKMHCAVMGYEALQSALAAFRGEARRFEHEEGALVCRCHGVDERVIEGAIREHQLTSVEQVTARTMAGSGCTTCYERIEDILVRVTAEALRIQEAAQIAAEAAAAQAKEPAPGTVTLLAARPRPAQPRAETPRPASAVAASSPLTPSSPLPPPSAGMTNLKKIRLIEETIEDLRVYLRKDGGDCELIDVDGSNVLVSLTGACVGCQMASVTVSGIQERLIAKLGIPMRVIPVGRNAHGL